MIRKVLIIGGGIGGLSTAIALRKAGIDVDLVEIKTDWKVYHVGIIVQGNFIRAMAALGIADKAVAAGFPYFGVKFQTLHGHTVAEIPGIPMAGPQLPTDLGMGRPALHKILSEAALELGTNVRLGMTFNEIQQNENQLTHIKKTLAAGFSVLMEKINTKKSLTIKAPERNFVLENLEETLSIQLP